MKNQLSGRFISFMGAGVRPLMFLSSFKSTEGPHCCFVSKPLDLYLAVCIRDISSKNATSDGGFCVGYTKDGPRFAATSVKQTHAQRHGGGLQCLWNTSLQHVYAYITFFFFFPYHKCGFNCYSDYATPPLLLWSFCVAVPLSRGKHPPSPHPPLQFSRPVRREPSGSLRHKQGRK